MKQPVYTKQFEKDLKRMLKRNKNADKLKTIVRLLLADEQLDIRYRDHALSGNYNNRRECHIEPDWLLIYKPEEERIIFERTGTHSDLF